MTPLLVVISGPPGTGKSTLGRRLAAGLSLPYVSKDGIKETLFNRLGWKDRDWSRTLGLASYDLLFYFTEVLLAAGCSFILESNFDPEAGGAQLRAIQARVPFRPFRIQCQADGEVLFQRFIRRSESGERHPGHNDELAYTEFRAALLQGRQEPLPLDGPLFILDTTDFSALDYAPLYSALHRALAGGE